MCKGSFGTTSKKLVFSAPVTLHDGQSRRLHIWLQKVVHILPSAFSNELLSRNIVCNVYPRTYRAHAIPSQQHISETLCIIDEDADCINRVHYPYASYVVDVERAHYVQLYVLLNTVRFGITVDVADNIHRTSVDLV